MSRVNADFSAQRSWDYGQIQPVIDQAADFIARLSTK